MLPQPLETLLAKIVPAPLSPSAVSSIESYKTHKISMNFPKAQQQTPMKSYCRDFNEISENKWKLSKGKP